jgi:8-oxo-dGTP diphosphatase
MAKKKMRVRVGVLVLHDGKVLLAKQHVSQGQDFWIVPGGGLKKDEGLLDCARREIAEETGLAIEPIRLLYIGDFFKADQHVVDTFWLAKVVGGELRRRAGEIDSLRFFDVERLGSVAIKPPAMAERFLIDFQQGFGSETVYLGKYYRNREA